MLPGELAAHQIVSSVLDAMLKRGESRTVGNRKASRCNVLEQRISTGHQATKRAETLPRDLLWRPRGLQLPIKVI